MENGGRGRTAGKTERGENRRNVRKGPWQVRLLAESEKAACRELWENIFAEDWYEPSSKVRQIHDDIIYLTGITEDTTAMKTNFEGDSQ